MSKKYGIVFDAARCTGCFNCQLACKDENCNEAHEGYTAAQPMTGQFWRQVTEVERGAFPKVKINHISRSCGHCDNPVCVTRSKDGAVYKRPDGIVIIDPEKAKGQKDILNSCPNRMVWWNEELQLPQKCDMCAHLLDRGYPEPRCVEVCSTGALVFGDQNDPDSLISKIIKQYHPTPLHPEFGQLENVLYLNIPRKFVTGTVINKADDQCFAGAKVTLKGEDVEMQVETDVFGDFWFDGLDKNKPLTVTIEAEGYGPVTLNARTQNNVDLGEIFLEK